MYIFNKYIYVCARELYLGILYGEVIIFSLKVFNCEEGLPYSHVSTHRYCVHACTLANIFYSKINSRYI